MDEFSSVPQDFLLSAIFWVFAVIFGLLLGSFSTAIAYRTPRGIPWAYADKNPSSTFSAKGFSAYRSACTRCKTQLKPIDLVPIFSWLSTKGLCRYCKTSISRVYPITEALVLACVLAVFGVYGFSIEALVIVLVIPFLMALLIVDLERMILPNQLVFIVAVLGILKLLIGAFIVQNITFFDFFMNYLLAAPLYGVLAWLLGWAMTALLKKDALGFGDVKFFMAAGLWLGAGQLGYFCILSGVIGFAFAVIWKYLKGQDVFPFGPALIVSLFVLLLLKGAFLL